MAGPTILDLPAITDDVAVDDVLYLVRGTAAGRDKQFTGSLVRPSVVNADTTQTIDLSTYQGDVIIFSTPTSNITLTLSNMINAGRKIIVVNKSSTYTVALAGSILLSLYPEDLIEYYSDGTNLFQLVNSGQTTVILTGETIEPGRSDLDCVYYNTSNSRWELASWSNVPQGIITDISIDEITLMGQKTGLSGLTPGIQYMDNGGQLTTTRTAFKIGIAPSATELLVDIDTGEEARALAEEISWRFAHFFNN